MYKKTSPEGFGAGSTRRFWWHLRYCRIGYDAYYIKAQQLRRLIAQDFVEPSRRCDVIGPGCVDHRVESG